MAENSTGPEPPQDAEHAAADWLFQDDPAPAKKPPQPAVDPSGEGFDLADSPPPTAGRRPFVPPPSWEEDAPPEPGRGSKKADSGGSARPREREERRERPAARRLDAAPAVDHPWSRGAEWGPTIAAIVGWGVAVWVAIYFLLVSEMYPVAFLALAIGAVVGLALFYPIVVTLERPTRMTPEQALNDYYQALSHHLPHYRRMWLLLSNAGRTSSKFASYEGFKRYWKGRVQQLREGKAKGWTPLAFVVSGYKSEKSGGKTEIAAKWTVQVFVRGRREEGPVATFPTEGTLAKGPDNMWYIDDGTLGERPRQAERAGD